MRADSPTHAGPLLKEQSKSQEKSKMTKKNARFPEMTSIKEIAVLHLDTANYTEEQHSTGKRSPSNKYILQGAKSTRNL